MPDREAGASLAEWAKTVSHRVVRAPSSELQKGRSQAHYAETKIWPVPVL